jgi:hypothetical protein
MDRLIFPRPPISTAFRLFQKRPQRLHRRRLPRSLNR